MNTHSKKLFDNAEYLDKKLTTTKKTLSTEMPVKSSVNVNDDDNNKTSDVPVDQSKELLTILPLLLIMILTRNLMMVLTK